MLLILCGFMNIGFMSYLGSIVVFTVYSLLLHGLLSICWLSTMSSSSTLVSTRFYATDLLPLVMLITWMITFSAIFVLVVFYPLPTLASAYQGFVSRLVTSTQ